MLRHFHTSAHTNLVNSQPTIYQSEWAIWVSRRCFDSLVLGERKKFKLSSVFVVIVNKFITSGLDMEEIHSCMGEAYRNYRLAICKCVDGLNIVCKGHCTWYTNTQAETRLSRHELDLAWSSRVSCRCTCPWPGCRCGRRAVACLRFPATSRNCSTFEATFWWPKRCIHPYSFLPTGFV